MRRLALIAVTALLWSCQQQTDDTSAAPPSTALPETPLPDDGASTVPPPANETAVTTEPDKAEGSKPASDFHAPLRAIGTEPFWAVRIGDKITVQRPSEADIVVANAGPTINRGVAVWNTPRVTIRLEAQPGCSDGMSDNRYPYAATVTLDGQVLKGCAAREDQWPREGEG